MKRHGTDLRIAQVARVAQDARRLFEQLWPVQVAAVEQQLVFDRRLARRDVQAIAEARQRGVFVVAFRVEQVARIETDLADARALRLELRVATADPGARGASAFGARALTLGRTRACAAGAQPETDQGNP